MKANKVPEKIYIQPELGEGWYLRNYHGNPLVEYTRTDAFIEKAAKWMKDKAESYIIDTPLCSYFDYKRAVEDFKNYMKGE